MKDVLFSLGAVTEEEARKLDQSVETLNTDLKVCDAVKILLKIQADLEGLSPTICHMIASLQKASIVIGFLRGEHLVEDVKFQRYRYSSLKMTSTCTLLTNCSAVYSPRRE